MYFALIGLWLFAAFSINAEKSLPRSWLRPLGLVQWVVGGLALAFGLYCIIGDALSQNTMSSGFGILVGAIIAFPGLMLVLAGRLNRKASEEEDAVLDESDSLSGSPYLAPIYREDAEEMSVWKSTRKKVAMATLALGLIGWVVFVCLDATAPKGQEVMFEEIRADHLSPFEFSVTEPLGGKYLIVVNTGYDANPRKHGKVKAGYKFECALLDPNGREVFRKGDEYYSRSDRKITFVPTVPGTYRLSIQPASTVKGSVTYPSVRVYRQ